MIAFRYSEFDPLKRHLHDSYEELKKLFDHLLLKTHGDADQALQIMEQLKERGYLPAQSDIRKFAETLRKKDQIQVDPRTGYHRLTDRGIQGLRQSSLLRSFKDFKEGGEQGEHRSRKSVGNSPDLLPELRGYQQGDDFDHIHFGESLQNTLRRTGDLQHEILEEDLVVQEREKHVSCSTILLLDISHSMILYGEDRFTPAKQVALALTELILTRFKRDTLDVILFGNEAIPVPIKELPFVGVGPFHTNTKAGLVAARRVLERRKSSHKQIFMVTDGKPTVIDEPGGGIYRNSFGLDDRIINRTLDEAIVCRRKNIPITTFMVTRDSYLEQFVLKLTELNQGKAYFSSPNQLGGFVLMDFMKNRKGRA